MFGGIIKFILIVLALVFLAGYYVGTTYGETIVMSRSQSQPISITDYTISLTQPCIALLKINDTSCPSYADILQVFPDQSDQSISGAFSYYDGYYHRAKSIYTNQYKYYDYYHLPSIVWIDPPSDVTKKARNIIIAASDFDYKIKGAKVDTTTNNTLTIGTNRYVDPTCTYAIITKNNWLFLAGDTLRLMQNNCDPKYTNFDETKIITWTRTLHDWTTSSKYKLEQWQKESIINCGTQVCIRK